MKKNKKNEKYKREKLLKIISILFTIVSLFCFSLLAYHLNKVNIIPTKYIINGSIAAILFLGASLFVLYTNSKNVFKVLIILLMFMTSIFSCITSNYLNHTYKFVLNTKKDYDTLIYSVLVLKENNYEKMGDLSLKNISYLNDHYIEDVKRNLNEKINYQEILVDDGNNMIEKLLNREVEAIVLEEGYFNLMKESNEEFMNQTKVIYSFEVSVNSYEEETEDIDVSKDSFILYISGIDQYGNVRSVRGRSDVNQLAVVNPKTHQILLVNTPRDYYVQLDGTTGLKDKLTHAGIYGVEKSIKTLENFYDLDIDHYLRVNFNTLIKVVDVIGGIDINSDKAFTAYTNKNVHVKAGLNHFNGEEALAYARERYAYTTGDNHRGENQQQVISAIIDQLTSSKVLMSKYKSILKTLDGSFVTDMPTNMLTNFIKMQLDDGEEWHIEGIQVTGSGSSDYTYSMGTKQKLYVMEPNMNSVNKAKAKIQEVYHAT